MTMHDLSTKPDLQGTSDGSFFALVLILGALSPLLGAVFTLHNALVPYAQRRWPGLRVPSRTAVLSFVGAVLLAASLWIVAHIEPAEAGAIAALIGVPSIAFLFLAIVARGALALPVVVRHVQDTGLASLSAHQRLALLARATAAPKTPASPHA